MPRMMSAFAVISSCSLAGCTFSAEAGPTPVVVAGDGVLTIDWTIDGEFDPDECDQSGAETFDALITTRSGTVMGEFGEACDRFVMSIELPPGSYYGDAVLLDRFDYARTTAVDLGPVEIYGYDELFVSVDFPSSSFY